MLRLLVLCVLLFVAASAHKICYPHYGCFGDDAPFNHPFILLPQNPDVIKTAFQLYTRKSMTTPQPLDPVDASSAASTHFNGTQKTVIIAHGYLRSLGVQFWERPMIEALLKKDDINVIFLDWTIGAGFPYHQAVGNARLVGKQLSTLLTTLLTVVPPMDAKEVHCVGMALGAEVCGYAGRNMRNANQTIGRITALDPVALYFENEHVDRRLDTTDADFVDAIHTDTNTIYIGGLGTAVAMAHMDFYPNGGYSQPNCYTFGNGIKQVLTCSHYRAAQYFTESINPRHCPFKSYKAEDCDKSGCDQYDSKFKLGLFQECDASTGCVSMGYDSVKHAGSETGKFYLKTRGEEPFCNYHYRIQISTGSKTFADLNGEVYVKLVGEKETSEIVTIPSHYYKSGSNDYFLITTRFDLGALKRVQVKHGAWIDGWLLEYVVVRPLWSESDKYTGCFKRWLNKDDNEVDFHTGQPGLCI